MNNSFNFLKADGKAKKRYLDFLYKIKERGIQLQDDDDISEETLMEAAAIGDGSSSTTLSNTNMLTIVSRFHRSAVTRSESAANADDKTGVAHGVDVGRPNLQVFPVSKIPTDDKARTDGRSRQEARTDVGS